MPPKRHKKKPSYHNMSTEDYRKEMHKSGGRFKNESAFEAWVIQILHVNGWIVTSMKDSRQQRWDADGGHEDLHAAHEYRYELLWAELKMPGKPATKKQVMWLRHHRKVADMVNSLCKAEKIIVRLWEPKDEDEIIRLAGGLVPLR